MLYYELVHNLVLELTRVGIENRNLKMRLESLSSRMDFDERRARALETVVQYRPGTGPAREPQQSAEPPQDDRPYQPPTAGASPSQQPAPAPIEQPQAARGWSRDRQTRHQSTRTPRAGAGAGAVDAAAAADARQARAWQPAASTDLVAGRLADTAAWRSHGRRRLGRGP